MANHLLKTRCEKAFPYRTHSMTPVFDLASATAFKYMIQNYASDRGRNVGLVDRLAFSAISPTTGLRMKPSPKGRDFIVDRNFEQDGLFFSRKPIELSQVIQSRHRIMLSIAPKFSKNVLGISEDSFENSASMAEWIQTGEFGYVVIPVADQEALTERLEEIKKFLLYDKLSSHTNQMTQNDVGVALEPVDDSMIQVLQRSAETELGYCVDVNINGRVVSLKDFRSAIDSSAADGEQDTQEVQPAPKPISDKPQQMNLAF